MSFGPVFGSVADQVNKYIATTELNEFTARNIAEAIGVKAVNVVSAALSKLKSDGKITYRVIEHEKWGRPIHLYLNPRQGAQVPVVTPPRPVADRFGRRELVNPGCTAIVDDWIEKQLIGGEDGLRFTSTAVAEGTGIPGNRISALLNTLRYKRKIRVIEKNGCQNIYFTTKKMFHSYAFKRRRKAPATVVLAERPVRERDRIGGNGLVDQLLEDAIRIEKTGVTREICLNLIETLCTYLKVMD